MTSVSYGQKVERNNIYFTFDYLIYDSTGCDFGVFSFTNKRIRHFSCPKSRADCVSGSDMDKDCLPSISSALPVPSCLCNHALSYTEPPKTKGFRVFKLECDIDAGPQWMEVVELGGRVLFVSNHHSAVYCTLWSKGKKNNIYFDFDYSCYDSTGCNYGIFSFTNKSIRHFSCPKSRSWSQLYTTSLCVYVQS
ncbi:hypothetical protein DVH24_028472 [Malus domestica]|uniref:KIB1-4 beta-propeller domain-containing protein n=1 Tax=Malus domestica TaxID=3750 RepID=A0A498KPM1_MALDO|nr:hypothetical protein DVH24_028472 [Malus domestica]